MAPFNENRLCSLLLLLRVTEVKSLLTIEISLQKLIVDGRMVLSLY